MRAEFPGYYRHSEKELEALWKSAVVVPDTNILLALYRLGEPTREKLLAILDGLGERLFVPHQVALEFQENRLGVIEEQKRAYDDLDRELEKLSTSVLQKLRQHPRLDKGELTEQIEAALAPIREEVAAVKEGHPNPLTDGHALGSDSVRDALDTALAGRVGEPRNYEELKKVGAARYERKQAPGWKDKDKLEPERYGDLAIWLDAVDRAKEMKKPLIVVTEERKEDWWWEERGVLIGPCPELVDEVKNEADQAFHLSNLAQFMEAGANALGLEFSDDERDDVARAQKAAPKDDRAAKEAGWGGWTLQTGPLASGAVPSGELPDGFHWVNPILAGAQIPTPRFSNAGFNEPQRWYHSAEVEDNRVVLEVWWKPQFYGVGNVPRAEFTCLVLGPDDTAVVAACSGQDARARLVFPDDFGESAEARPGTYRYRWSCSESPETHAQGGTWIGPAFSKEIAAGAFELDQLGDPNSESE